jgi:hypothetical protein
LIICAYIFIHVFLTMFTSQYSKTVFS